METFEINIRISRDETGKKRFSKKEVVDLINTGQLKFSRNLLLRISDGKVVGELIAKI